MAEKALLIGIPEYRFDSELNLDVVSNDIRVLSECWISLGVDCDIECPDSKDFSYSLVYLKTRIREFFSSAEDDDTLHLYWTGHGGNLRGKDYLLTVDYSRDTPENLTDTAIVLSDIIDYAQASSATKVLIYVDACRSNLVWDVESTKEANQLSPGQSNEHQSNGFKSIAVIYSCSSGEYSWYSDKEKVENDMYLSHFTNGLIQAFSKDTPPRTVQEVLDFIQSHLNEIGEATPKKKQNVRLRHDSGINASLDWVIAESPETPLIKAKEANPWIRAILTSRVWSHTYDQEDIGSDSMIPMDTMKEVLRSVLGACWLTIDNYRSVVPNDPWFDQNYPIRVVEAAKVLLKSVDLKLRSSEIGVLTALPFIFEAVFAQIKINHFQSFDNEKKFKDDCYWDRFILLKGALPQWERKISSLTRQNKNTEATWVQYWLANLAIMRSPEFRLEFQNWVENNLSMEILDCEYDYVLKSVFDAKRLSSFLEAGLTSSDSLIKYKDRFGVITEFGKGDYSFREILIATLYKVSCSLAIDLRRLPAALPDHIGVEDPVLLEECKKNLKSLYWIGKRSLDAKMGTSHPAFDSAVLDYVQEIDSEYQKLLFWESLPVELTHLPIRLSSDNITVLNQGNSPAFSRPHLKFTLAQDEIRELLMGVQLYRDPKLAIRELYQNSIDACRYKQARINYKCKTDPTYKDTYKPLIIFRQGVDELGRRYIECIDNGIGMDRQIFQNVFAKAGKRFSEMPEFVEEQKYWDEFGIKIYPNSQFGVGVLSYFMLADHLEIKTTRFEKDGRLGDSLSASITGSGNLFRIIVPSRRPSETGTRIRLYLRYDIEISIQEVLSSLVVIPEYKLLVEVDETEESWNENEIRTKKEVAYSGIPNIWWSSIKHGDVLSDGIKIKSHSNKNLQFLLVNLKNENKPKLSIDRNEIVYWNKNSIISTIEKSTIPNLANIDVDFDFIRSVKEAGSQVLFDKLIDKVCEDFRKISVRENAEEKFELNMSVVAKLSLNNQDFRAIEVLSSTSQKYKTHGIHSHYFDRARLMLGLKELPPDLKISSGYRHKKIKDHRHVRFTNRILRIVSSCKSLTGILANVSLELKMPLCDVVSEIRGYQFIFL